MKRPEDSRQLGNAIFVLAGMLALPPAVGTAAQEDQRHGRDLWQQVSASPAGASQRGARPSVQPSRFRSYTLDRNGIVSLAATAPRERTRAAREQPLLVSLPDPTGGFQLFALVESPVMEDGLAAKHPDIKTYSGRGIDDPTASLRADITPLGFHASVRSTKGAWYVEPYYHLDQSLYVSYYRRDLQENPHGVFTDVVERDGSASEISTSRAYYHPPDPVALHGAGFAANAQVTITISDPHGVFSERSVVAFADALGAFDADFAADPAGSVGPHQVLATDGAGSAMTLYDVVADEDTSHDPPTGDVLRTYRLALITDPGYAAFFGGSANVTPAKVTLINRVTQLYEGDLSIRLLLVANNDQLNLDAWEDAIAPNGPCGAAACFTQSQVTGCSSTSRARYVIGQIIGASNYDIGHLALGQPGGGVANLGVVGRSAKAGGCTGIPTPVGDFYAVDYVAHEMGHQFSGNHPFNGNQLNCSGGNRSSANSVEPGSGSSIMAYAGICLTDDLQPHSDPYFSERSLQEISTYTTSSPAAINEVQTASLRHFGGGNEVQVVTFGPGLAPASTIQPLSLTINAAPSATSRGGADEDGNTVTIATSASHTLQVGDTVTIAGVGVAGYDGTWTVTARPTSRSFEYTNPVSGLATSGGGTVTLAIPGATESGTTVTISTAANHGRSVGEIVTIAGVGVAGYNGTVTLTAVPTPRTFQYTAAAGLANSGGGTATLFSPFQVRIGGNDSAVIGGGGLAYTAANLTTAINAIAGFAGTATVTGAASTGFTVTYTGASAGLDVPNLEIVNLSCGGCFASVEETNHAGAPDSFTINYNGADSAPITNGVNYTSAGIAAALTPILPAGATVTITNFGGGGAPSSNGFQVTFGGTLAATNVPVLLSLTNLSAGLSGFFGETDKGGAVDNKGGIITPTGNSFPGVTAPAGFTIPLRTPFYLTGSATDADLDTLVYAWEQNDRGGSAGTSLLNNTKTNGPLFAMFPKSGQISDSDSLLYDSPGENHLTTDPTRVFPDLQQILDNNTNADTGSCPGSAEIAPPVPIDVKECFSEFLPTSDYVGFTGVNASPLSLHFRFTARDGRGGVNAADTTLLLATNAGPFRVTSPNTAVALDGGSTQSVTWDVASTDVPPVDTAAVKISLSTDGGHTYSYVLAASTANDGSEPVSLPNVGTANARVLIEAVGNIFFDVSNSDFTIVATQTILFDPLPNRTYGEADFLLTASATSGLPVSFAASGACTVAAATVRITGVGTCSITASQAGGDTYYPAPDVIQAFTIGPAVLLVTPKPATPSRQYSDPNPAFSPTITGYVYGENETALGALPSCETTATSSSAPGPYPITCSGGAAANYSFSYVAGTLTVTREDAEATYTGDMLAVTAPGGSTASVLLRASVRDSSLIPAFGDTWPGDIRNATVTFKEGATTLCGPVGVALLNGATTTGTAACNAELAIGDHTLDIVVDGYYAGSALAVVAVGEPDGSHVTGGGDILIGASGGRYKADPGSSLHFGFNVKYKDEKKDKKPKKDPKGEVKVVFQAGGRKYEIKSKDIEALGVASKTPGGAECSAPPSATCFGLADIRAKASLTDVTPKRAHVSIGVNLTLQVTATDRGKPGSADSIGVTLWDGSTLLFSSHWTGVLTLEQTLAHGKIVVH